MIIGTVTLPSPQWNVAYNNEGSSRIRITRGGNMRTSIVRPQYNMIQMVFDNVGEQTMIDLETYIIANNGVEITMTDQYSVSYTGYIRLNNFEYVENYTSALRPVCTEQVSTIRNRRYTITIQFEVKL